ncbi:hypothetical protein C8J57DRAFT_1274205 [Mycena rebaudengoi]|nr:hypothetical protein C8J57DRAFT_1274205 [Mycena rebaudengoi]
MSFLLGPLSGALVAGGVYYGYSNMIQARTQQHIHDLHTLSVRLADAPALIIAPPSAAARVTPRPLRELVQARWNEEVAGLYKGVGRWEERVGAWGREIVQGPNTGARSASDAQER